MSSDLVRRTQETQAKTLATTGRIEDFVRSDEHALQLALADRIGVDRFIAAAVTTFRSSAKLGQTTPESRLGALYIAAQLGLEIGGPRGLVYVVPYGNQATLVVGYKGFVDLFYRAGARKIDWFVVRQGDHFRMMATADRGLVYEWAPAGGVPDEKQPWTGVVASVETKNGGTVWQYMTKAEVLARRPKPTPDPWKKWEEQMALKTVLRQLAKRVPLSTELALAESADETIQKRVAGETSQPVALHLPVEGMPSSEPRLRVPSGEHPLGDEPEQGVAGQPQEDVPPPEEDEEARYERESTEAFNAAQEPM